MHDAWVRDVYNPCMDEWFRQVDLRSEADLEVSFARDALDNCERDLSRAESVLASYGHCAGGSEEHVYEF